jgi:putative membrane protein
VSEPTGEVGWKRTSALGFAVGALMNLRNMILPMAAALFGTQGWDGGLIYVVPAIVLGLALTVLFSWVAWRHFRYRLGDSDIRVERGLLSRTARSVPYERIQDVSLEQSLVPRLFGMVEVKFETGAGGKDELKIGYITVAEGAAMRETVRAGRAGEPAPEAVAAAPEAEARTLFAMDLGRLATFGVFEFSLVVFAVLGGAAQQFDFLLPFDIWNFEAWTRMLAGPGHWLEELGFAAQAIGAALDLATLAIVGLVTGLGRTVLRDYGFRLDETPKGLRRRRGLLTRTDVVMPLHRVQALKLTTGIVRRRFGWHGLSVVSLATDAKDAHHVVVPFAKMDEIAPVVETSGFALPDTSTQWRLASVRQRNDSIALTVILFGLLAGGAALFFSSLPHFPAVLPLLVPVGLGLAGVFFAAREWYLWRHRRHARDARQLFVRHGWLAPRLDIASRVKLQSVEITQGPWARRRGYAALKFGIAGGTLEMQGVPLAEARAIRAEVLDSIAAVDFSRLGEAA